MTNANSHQILQRKEASRQSMLHYAPLFFIFQFNSVFVFTQVPAFHVEMLRSLVSQNNKQLYSRANKHLYKS